MADGQNQSMKCFFRVFLLQFRAANSWQELEEDRAVGWLKNGLPNPFSCSKIFPKM